jgi:hypothetical protein
VVGPAAAVVVAAWVVVAATLDTATELELTAVLELLALLAPPAPLAELEAGVPEVAATTVELTSEVALEELLSSLEVPSTSVLAQAPSEAAAAMERTARTLRKVMVFMVAPVRPQQGKGFAAWGEYALRARFRARCTSRLRPR